MPQTNAATERQPERKLLVALSSIVIVASAMSISRPVHASEHNVNLKRFAFTGSFRFATRQPVIVLAAPHRNPIKQPTAPQSTPGPSAPPAERAKPEPAQTASAQSSTNRKSDETAPSVTVSRIRTATLSNTRKAPDDTVRTAPSQSSASASAATPSTPQTTFPFFRAQRSALGAALPSSPSNATSPLTSGSQPASTQNLAALPNNQALPGEGSSLNTELNPTSDQATHEASIPPLPQRFARAPLEKASHQSTVDENPPTTKAVTRSTPRSARSMFTRRRFSRQTVRRPLPPEPTTSSIPKSADSIEPLWMRRALGKTF